MDMKKIISLTAVALVALVVSGCGTATKPNILQEGGVVPVMPETKNAPVINTTLAETATTAIKQATPAVKNKTVKVSTKAISIQNFAFNPGSVTITKGTVVTWVNNDSIAHQIKSADFNSSILNQGQSFSFTFNQTGIFNYFCAIHPAMLGSITVE